MSTTALASSVDTDVMDGEKIELDMSRQLLEPSIQTHGSEGSDARGYWDSTTPHDSSITKARGKKDNDHRRTAVWMKP